jgi:hypothetical protein
MKDSAKIDKSGGAGGIIVISKVDEIISIWYFSILYSFLLYYNSNLIYMNIKETIREIINTFTLVQWWWYNNDNTANINYYQIMGMKQVLF